ncbi:MAG TPA: response regulator [Burkholderiales bacterium]|nr:response regulator [Burkholderiales bacterium]
MKPIRVLLVDDDRDFLAVAQYDLKSLPRVSVVGCAMSGDEAVKVAPLLKPDVVLMDIDMPGMNGIEATRALKALDGAPKVLAQSFLDPSAAQDLGKLTGADGYVYKGDFVAQVNVALDALFGAGA